MSSLSSNSIARCRLFSLISVQVGKACFDIRSPRETAAPISRSRRSGLRKTRPFLKTGFLGHVRGAVRPPGSARTDQVLEDLDSVSVYRQVRFITAPSMTTPTVTYFRSATSNLRASATIVVFLRRPDAPQLLRKIERLAPPVQPDSGPPAPTCLCERFPTSSAGF
jgi:hypothetical protein